MVVAAAGCGAAMVTTAAASRPRCPRPSARQAHAAHASARGRRGSRARAGRAGAGSRRAMHLRRPSASLPGRADMRPPSAARSTMPCRSSSRVAMGGPVLSSTCRAVTTSVRHMRAHMLGARSEVQAVTRCVTGACLHSEQSITRPAHQQPAGSGSEHSVSCGCGLVKSGHSDARFKEFLS